MLNLEQLRSKATGDPEWLELIAAFEEITEIARSAQSAAIARNHIGDVVIRTIGTPRSRQTGQETPTVRWHPSRGER